MGNLSIDNQNAAAVASLTSTTTPAGTRAPAYSLTSPLYSQSDVSAIVTAATSAPFQLGQLVDSPVILIKTKGDDAMQQVDTKVVTQPSSGCSDGVLASGMSAAGTLAGEAAEATKEAPANTSTAFGEAGKYVGTGLCEAGIAVGSAVKAIFQPDENNPPIGEGNGETCTDPGPTGGQSAGKTGGYCKDPDAGFTPDGTYTDPTTGEPITNKDGKTTAGDPNADPGTDIGDVDDPAFLQDQSTASPNSSSSSSSEPNSSSSTNTDNSSQGTQPDAPETEETQPSDPVGPNPTGSMPADDSSGSGGVAGPRANIYSVFTDQAMPSDDSAGGGTPRSNVANVANSGLSDALRTIALSRSNLT